MQRYGSISPVSMLSLALGILIWIGELLQKVPPSWASPVSTALNILFLIFYISGPKNQVTEPQISIPITLATCIYGIIEFSYSTINQRAFPIVEISVYFFRLPIFSTLSLSATAYCWIRGLGRSLRNLLSKDPKEY